MPKVRLPKEVKSEFEKKLISYYKQVYNIDNNSFNKVTNELARIFTKQDTNTDMLKNSLEELFQAFPQFINIKQNTNEKGVHGNEDLVHSVFNYIALQIKGFSRFGTEVWYKNEGRADVILVNDTENIGMIIELKYDCTAEKALDQTEKYLPIFKECKNILFIKSLGINVSQDKKVNIKSKLQQNKYSESI